MSTEDVAAFEPKRRSLWFKLMLVLCAVVLAFAGWLFLERIRGQAALKKYEQELIAKGEKLRFADVVSTAYEPKNRDAAIEFVALCNRLQTGAVLIANAPPATRTIATGKLLVITKETGWVDASGRYVAWKQVAEDLDRNRDILNEMKALVHKPPLSYPINYRGFMMLLPHLAPMKRSAQWFSASSLHNLHGGNVDRSIEEVEAILLSAQMLENEPIIISQMVRIGMVAIAIQNCWHLLQHDEVSDAQLPRLQRLFSPVDFASGMIRALQVERAMGSDAIQSMRTGELSFSTVAGSGGWFHFDDDMSPALEKVPYAEELQEGIRSILLYPTWRFALSYNDEKRLLQETQRIIDSTRLSRTNRSTAELRTAAASLDSRLGGEIKSWRHLATGLFLPPLEPVTMRSFRAQTHCEIVKAAIALKRYQIRNQSYPAKLADLVPEFLPEVPIDYIDGAPLRYRIDRNSFLLWSIGNNVKDDGGSPAERGFSWAAPLGKDTVWPQAASEADVAAYRESQSKRVGQKAPAAKRRHAISEQPPDE